MRVRVTDEVHCSMGGKAQTVVIQRDQVEINFFIIVVILVILVTWVILVTCITILICRRSPCQTSRSQRQGSSSPTPEQLPKTDAKKTTVPST